MTKIYSDFNDFFNEVQGAYNPSDNIDALIRLRSFQAWNAALDTGVAKCLRLKKEAEEWEKLAESWKKDYDFLKEKYEPTCMSTEGLIGKSI